MTDSFDDDSAYDFAPRDEPPPPSLPPPEAEPDLAPSSSSAALPLEREEPALICPHCGFEMFEKPRSGRCPDCAAPIDVYSADLLQFADGDWITTLSNGCLLVGLAILIDIGAVVVRFLDSPKVGIVVHLLAAGALVLGVNLATKREESLIAPASPTAAPARITAYAIVALWVLLLLISFTGKAGLIKFFTIVILIAYGTMANLLAFHFQKLATRIPADSLASQSVNLGWLLPIVCLVLLVVNAVNLAGPQALMFFFCSFPMIGGLVGILLWALSVCLRLAMDLRAAAAAGEAIAVRKAQRLAAKKK